MYKVHLNGKEGDDHIWLSLEIREFQAFIFNRCKITTIHLFYGSETFSHALNIKYNTCSINKELNKCALDIILTLNSKHWTICISLIFIQSSGSSLTHYNFVTLLLPLNLIQQWCIFRSFFLLTLKRMKIFQCESDTYTQYSYTDGPRP